MQNEKQKQKKAENVKKYGKKNYRKKNDKKYVNERRQTRTCKENVKGDNWRKDKRTKKKLPELYKNGKSTNENMKRQLTMKQRDKKNLNIKWNEEKEYH